MAKKEIKGFNIKCLNEAGTVVLAYDAVGYYYGNKYISIDLNQTSIIDSISSKMKILNATLELTAKKWNLGPSFEGMDVYINDELIEDSDYSNKYLKDEDIKIYYNKKSF